MIRSIRSLVAVCLAALAVWGGWLSVLQWSAEAAFPSETTFISRQEGRPEFEGDEKVRRLRRAEGLAPLRHRYKLFMGVHWLNQARAGASGREEALREAALYLTRALDTNPVHSETLIYLGWVRFMQGEPYEALSLMDRAMEFEPNLYFGYQYYGLVLAENLDELPRGERRLFAMKGVRMIERAMELNPELVADPRTLGRLADLQLALGRKDLALGALRKIRRLTAESYLALGRLALLEVELGDRARGLRLIGRALQYKEGVSEAKRAWVLGRIERYVKTRPHESDLALALGRALMEDGQWGRAMVAAELVLGKRPGSAEARDMYERAGAALESEGLPR